MAHGNKMCRGGCDSRRPTECMCNRSPPTECGCKSKPSACKCKSKRAECKCERSCPTKCECVLIPCKCRANNAVVFTPVAEYINVPPSNINFRYVSIDNATCAAVCIQIKNCRPRCTPIYTSPRFGTPLGGAPSCRTPSCGGSPSECVDTVSAVGLAPSAPIYLAPGEGKNVGINTIGDGLQIIHVTCPITGKLLGPPSVIETNANMFVVYDTCGAFHVSTFRRPSVRASY